MVIKPGGCNIKLKAMNAQRAGAEMLIISVDSEQMKNELINSANGVNSINIDIPTLMVNKEIVEKLRQRVFKSKSVKMKFQMPLPTQDIVDLQFFVVPTDSRMLSMIASFDSYFFKFENKVNLSVYFLKSSDSNDDNIDQITRSVKCLDHKILFEVLKGFSEFCVKRSNSSPDCLQNQINGQENKYVLEHRRCLQAKEDLSLFYDAMVHNNKGFGKGSYIYINSKGFHGSMKPDNLFEAVCNGFTHSPNYCLYLNNKYTPNTHYHPILATTKKNRIVTIVLNVMLSLFLLTLAAASLFIIYQKLYKQMLEVKTAEMIRQSVIDYQSLKNNE